MPILRFDKAFDIAQATKAFLKTRAGVTPESQKQLRRQKRLKSIREELFQRKRELSQIAQELHAAKLSGTDDEWFEQIGRHRSKELEIFGLETELRAAKERVEDELKTGTLPDFVVIGAPKCGTTFLYHLLIKHPYVEPAAFKEPHYFDLLFDKGTEWYRRCFPLPRLKDGRRTITGEATPSYLTCPGAPERMVEVIPQARLIALLRNPVDRIYSAYQHNQAERGRTTQTFEEFVEASLDDPCHGFLGCRIYVDHLLRWSKFFRDEQMLVLKSEDLFEHPRESLKLILDFLDLPSWEPGARDLRDERNEGKYEQQMDPVTRRRLEDYFEPHNRRLYEYLGMSFGW